MHAEKQQAAETVQRDRDDTIARQQVTEPWEPRKASQATPAEDAATAGPVAAATINADRIAREAAAVVHETDSRHESDAAPGSNELVREPNSQPRPLASSDDDEVRETCSGWHA